jgi:hypothetical protein
MGFCLQKREPWLRIDGMTNLQETSVWFHYNTPLAAEELDRVVGVHPEVYRV